jgi:glycosyltransferase involved in cell wall biosynthesis
MTPAISFPTLDDYAALQKRFADGRGERPLVSVVTVCRNAQDSIQRTARSVMSQRVSLEYIVVDGGSTDATVDRIKPLLRGSDLIVSEPDKGISDAMNKGISLARGEFVQLIHADDWMAEDQLERALHHIRETGADYVFGDLIFYEQDRPSFRYTGDPYYERSIDRLCPAINHPTVLARRSAYERFGLYSLELKRAMDYDWYLRLHRQGGRGAYSEKILAFMNHDGISNRDFTGTMDEVRRIAVAYGRSPARARAEWAGRIAKTTAGRALKRVSKTAYSGLRKGMNGSVQSAGDAH